MSIQPGRTDGGRPKIGPRITIAIPESNLRYIDWLVHEAHRRYERVPREYRTRGNLIREVLTNGLDIHHAHILTRPEREEDEAR